MGVGYEAFTASGEEDLPLVVSLKPDLVILDVVMPSISGFEVYRAVKLRPSLKSVRILILTTLSKKVDRRAIEDAWADGYLKKPFIIPDLLSKVDELLRRENEQVSK